MSFFGNGKVTAVAPVDHTDGVYGDDKELRQLTEEATNRIYEKGGAVDQLMEIATALGVEDTSTEIVKKIYADRFGPKTPPVSEDKAVTAMAMAEFTSAFLGGKNQLNALGLKGAEKDPLQPILRYSKGEYLKSHTWLGPENIIIKTFEDEETQQKSVYLNGVYAATLTPDNERYGYFTYKEKPVPPDGMIRDSFCEENDEYGVYANGQGGTYTRLIRVNSPACQAPAELVLDVSDKKEKLLSPSDIFKRNAGG